MVKRAATAAAVVTVAAVITAVAKHTYTT